jgi:hypothetical protein
MGTTRMRRDEYARCEIGCTHDLTAGVLVADLLAGDGPFNERRLLSSPIRGAPVRPQITPLENRAA